jgi:hypothetical protein
MRKLGSGQAILLAVMVSEVDAASAATFTAFTEATLTLRPQITAIGG